MSDDSMRKIPVALPLLGEEEAEATRRVILSGWVTQGPEVAAFEKEFAALVGAPHACAVSNCTTALHLALLVVGVQPGDEVITVSHSYIATANAVRHAGATPVFVDVEQSSGNIDPALILPLISERTRAILCVHQVGMPCDLAALVPLGRERGLPLIEDAACAMGSEILWNGQWERIGRPHGDVACFSFHPRKVITTGDGGMLTTARPDWDARFRLLRQHGMSVPDAARHGSPRVIFETHDLVGYNYRMTDIQAAVGREQLKRLPEIVARRRALAARYHELLAGIGLEADREPPWARSNWQSFLVHLPDGCDQRAFMQACLDRGVATRRGVMCAHQERAYEGLPHGPLSNGEARRDRTVMLPLYHQMTAADQDHVVSVLGEACARSGPR